MRRKKKLLSTVGVPTTPVEIKVPDYQTRQDFYDEERREQQATEARRQEDERKQRRALLYQQPSDYLQANCTHAPAMVTGNVVQQIRGAFDAFRLALEEQGVRLNRPAIEKFRLIAEKNLTIDLRVVANWTTLYQHMDELGAFSDSDRTITQPEPVAQPTPEPKATVNDLEKITISRGTDSERKAKRLVNDLLTREFEPIFRQFVEHLRTTWGHVTTEKQFEAMVNWFIDHPSADPRKGRFWTDMRLNLITQGVLPSTLRTPDEVLSSELEDADISDLNVRREFVRRTRQLSQV